MCERYRSSHEEKNDKTNCCPWDALWLDLMESQIFDVVSFHFAFILW